MLEQHLVILMVIGMVSMGLVALIADQNKLAEMIGGLIGAVIGAAASVLFTAVLAAIHRQLAGPSAGAIEATFD